MNTSLCWPKASSITTTLTPSESRSKPQAICATSHWRHGGSRRNSHLLEKVSENGTTQQDVINAQSGWSTHSPSLKPTLLSCHQSWLNPAFLQGHRHDVVSSVDLRGAVSLNGKGLTLPVGSRIFVHIEVSVDTEEALTEIYLRDIRQLLSLLAGNPLAPVRMREVLASV